MQVKANSLNSFCKRYSLSVLPKVVIDKAGNRVNISKTTWMVNENSKGLSIKWHLYAIDNPIIEYAFKRYIIQCIKNNSPGTVHTNFHKVISRLARDKHWYLLNKAMSIKETEGTLINLLSSHLQITREQGSEYNFTYIRAWYKWCVEQDLPGFNLQILYELLKIKIKGNPQGLAVLSENVEEGPLTDLEVSLLRNALVNDNGPLQERLSLWLSLSYGCNAANFVLLRELDFIERRFDSINEPFYELKIPRIKKRGQCHKRMEFKSRKIDIKLAELIKQQIKENAMLYPDIPSPRPLLMRNKAYKPWLNTDLSEFAYHLSTGQFHTLLNKCAKRLKLISPRTGKILRITPRRLRYTYATAMVKQGAASVELAELLDHSDLQNVRVYYNARSNIVERLDIALAERLAPLVNAFKGKIMPDEAQETNENQRIHYQEKYSVRKVHGIGTCGAKYLCNLYPPLSCYLCEKFQPWRNAPHGEILDDLIKERENRIKLYGENDRFISQLDDVIYSVAQVKLNCNQLVGDSE